VYKGYTVRSCPGVLVRCFGSVHKLFNIHFLLTALADEIHLLIDFRGSSIMEVGLGGLASPANSGACSAENCLSSFIKQFRSYWQVPTERAYLDCFVMD
jgi:hypothetical protein